MHRNISLVIGWLLITRFYLAVGKMVTSSLLNNRWLKIQCKTKSLLLVSRSML